MRAQLICIKSLLSKLPPLKANDVRQYCVALANCSMVNLYSREHENMLVLYFEIRCNIAIMTFMDKCFMI